MKPLKWVVIALLALLAGADFFIPKEHAALHAETIPGFYALFGLLAAVLIIAVAKILGRLFIMKRENYYDD